MRVLLGHNYYQLPGGEDNVYAAEASMLESFGHDVVRYTRHNDELHGFGPIRTGAITLWNRSSADDVGAIVERDRPDVCHFHNTFPLISPSVFDALGRRGVPVVLTLHNYRLICPGAVLMRDGQVCESCVGKTIPWRAVAHSCYRKSRAASAGVSAMLSVHHLLGTWKNRVDLYIALTEFARRKFVEGGLPAEKVAVKPNFIYPDPGFSSDRARHALFVGRLSPEKGIPTMLEAWKLIGGQVPLRIAGDGPMADEVRRSAEQVPGVRWLGPLTRGAVLSEMRQAAMLIFPSIWYEGLPLSILEAFATGLPLIASNLGSMAELVSDGSTGRLFAPGSAEQLADRVRWAASHRDEMRAMGYEARRVFEEKYTREKNHDLLMRCYRSAMIRSDFNFEEEETAYDIQRSQV
jgi:glycosyltransferase involved in cell wall biosynthesis